MTEKAYVPQDREWLQQTDWCGDFQPSLLGAPRTLAETSNQLKQSVQEKTVQTLESPVSQDATPSKKKNIFERLGFPLFGK